MDTQRYEQRPLTEAEAQTYAALLTGKLPAQFEIEYLVGARGGYVLSITIKGKPYNADSGVILATIDAVTNFINFLDMQEELAKQS